MVKYGGCFVTIITPSVLYVLYRIVRYRPTPNDIAGPWCMHNCNWAAIAFARIHAMPVRERHTMQTKPIYMLYTQIIMYVLLVSSF